MIPKNITPDRLNAMNANTAMEVLGIEYTAVTENSVSAKMPVDKRTHQPAGLLHGGATALLCETLGSVGSFLMVDPASQSVSGIEVNVNHLKGMREGWVMGTATIIHKGKSTHVWNFEARNEQNELIAVGRLTVMVINKKN